MPPSVWSFPDQGLAGLLACCSWRGLHRARPTRKVRDEQRTGGAVPNGVPRAGGALAGQPGTAWCREEPGVNALAAAPSSPSSLDTRPVPGTQGWAVMSTLMRTSRESLKGEAAEILESPSLQDESWKGP